MITKLRPIIFVTLVLLFFGHVDTINADGFDEAAYHSLMDAQTDAKLAPGTVITTENWTKYRPFIAVGLQWLYSGQYHWAIPQNPDYFIHVGPTAAIPPPHQFAMDTEKYSNQTRIVQDAGGGCNIDGYVAGLPFPHPSGPDAGCKVLFNFYYHYTPQFFYSFTPSYSMDVHHNKYPEYTMDVLTRLAHISTAGAQLTDPRANGYFFTEYNEVVEPEQSKYTAEMTLKPIDPNRQQEVYVFLPSLRRSLRLSSSARCAPFLGSDYLVDDVNDGFNGIPINFTAHLLGLKHLATLTHANIAERMKASNETDDPFPGWSKPAVGNWEGRDVYVLDLRPTKSLEQSYCYASRVLYVDAETYAPLFVDLYDRELRPWKVLLNRWAPIPLNDGFGSSALLDSDPTTSIWDLQNSHVTATWPGMVARVDAGVPSTYRDVNRYALPGGLAQMMK
jgi:hypothetical protein